MDVRDNVIVCGVDGSPASQGALAWALAEAKFRGCRLSVVTAWSWDGTEALGAPGNAADARSHAEIVQRRALLEALEDIEQPPEIERRLMEGRPSEALCSAALEAELLVLGSRGHNAMREALVGSTSQRVVRHASCPVVLLPDPRHVEHERRRRRHRRMSEQPKAAPLL
jgi:nucleotide-binding universal stress UspA family protein